MFRFQLLRKVTDQIKQLPFVTLGFSEEKEEKFLKIIKKILSYTAKDVCLSTGFARKRVNFPMDIFGTARGNRESQTLDTE